MLNDIKEMLREQVEYRELLYRMTQRDLMLRYKQTIMGFGWAVFMPLTNTAVFSIIFTRVAPIDTTVPYPLFAYTGLLFWNFLASALRFSVNSLVTNQALVTKVYFPREIFPFSVILASLVDLAVGSVVLIALMAYYGIAPGPAALFLPVVLVVQLAFTAGMGLLLAMSNLFYRDIKYLFELVLTLWMFGTSVVFPVSLVGGRLGYALNFNPMTPIIDAYRAVLFENRLPNQPFFALAVFSSAFLLVVGWLVFHRAEFKFAENI